ncbi:bifunctional adenosylcobinamide kinase/adenosylcobinamide-phosphate guanylyltransferase [Gordonia sp. HY002]|uniref:bifunctional adenosylcobinamide kinase/adenosylcobinamide-phosphate guanylyltransferase n=1 Tax=Gordonia zhenghanii TaxID=2911516 RepID=UPI001EFFE694|nr:bifunctional adenosylcobinamide kinase/adenosylcobinamide-phosphate guanylyltransferase [Gordonia zhenghanii]MCF8570101.1 bifunctional adenosylcobinamide kinase/adenosylcobinamide-phosphate guanylyltransferase [Gordonia zhenghanii]
MEVVLLGAGAADGWPNPFCGCGSCVGAASLCETRGQTSALVDDTLLLDCGPGVPGAAVRAGRLLAGVRFLLITHAHTDHLEPHVLLSRSWVPGLDELCVVGPTDAVDACRDWVGPDDPVRFLPVAAGDRVRLGGYDVRVLPARHRVFVDGDAVLYDVTGPDRSRLLWATDTGTWPRSWFDVVVDAQYDAVFLEETFGDRAVESTGHLGLSGFGDMLAVMREVGAATERTDVVAVHLGHHNPPIDELGRRLAELGARPGRDGEVVELGDPAAAGRTRPQRRHLFVTGGARSGKSRYAENHLADVDDVVYVAAGGPPDPHSVDAEWAHRIDRHQRRRPSSWTTLETTAVADVLRAATAPVLVDCLGTWLTARLDHHGVWESGDLNGVRRDVDELVQAWRSCPVSAVAVSNEVGSGVVPATPSGRLFRDELGRLNASIASISDTVVLMVAGQALVVR